MTKIKSTMFAISFLFVIAGYSGTIENGLRINGIRMDGVDLMGAEFVLSNGRVSSEKEVARTMPRTKLNLSEISESPLVKAPNK